MVRLTATATAIHVTGRITGAHWQAARARARRAMGWAAA
jgi:hypothetical protein